MTFLSRNLVAILILIVSSQSWIHRSLYRRQISLICKNKRDAGRAIISQLSSEISDENTVLILNEDITPQVGKKKRKSVVKPVTDMGENELVENDEKPTKAKPKRKPRATLSELTGYSFDSGNFTSDVPVIDDAMWYRVSVRRFYEGKVCDVINSMKNDEEYKNIIFDTYYPEEYYIKMKAKGLTYSTKPLVPGIVYLKLRMNPVIADDIETLPGVYGFTKTNNLGVVLPVVPEEAERLEELRGRPAPEMSEQQKKLRKDEYVQVVKGPLAGKYGILMGTKNGKIEICLRSEYKDEWDSFTLDELEYLAEPPEKKWNLMTAKEAVESLMSKDPYNPTIKSLKRQGLLNEILYPEGNDMSVRRRQEFKSGAEGGRSMRSIAKPSRDDNRAIASKLDDPFSPKETAPEVAPAFAPKSEVDSSAEWINRKVWSKVPKTSSSERPTSTEKPWESNRQKITSGDSRYIDDLLSGIEEDLDESRRKSPAVAKEANNFEFSSSDDEFFDEFFGKSSEPTRSPAPAAPVYSKTKPNSVLDFELNDLFEDTMKDMSEAINLRSEKKPSSSASTNAAPKEAPPRMENFASFEDYLDALVSFERKSGGANGKGAKGGKEKKAIDTLDLDFANLFEDDDADFERVSGDSREESVSDKSMDDLLRSLNNDLRGDDKPKPATANNNSGEKQWKKVVAAPAPPPSIEVPTAQVTMNENVDASTWERMTVKELREVLRERGLIVTGRKEDMIKRLL